MGSVLGDENGSEIEIGVTKVVEHDKIKNISTASQEDFISKITLLIQSLVQKLSDSHTNQFKDSVIVLPYLNEWASSLTRLILDGSFPFLAYFTIGTSTQTRFLICHEHLIQVKIKEVIKDETKPKRPDRLIFKTKAQREADEKKEKEIEDFKNGHLQPEEDETWLRLTTQHLDEIFNIVGVVEILKPESSSWEFGYDVSSELETDSLRHIIEIYGFPPHFRSKDILPIYDEFKIEGYSMIWVDETHLLLCFSTKEIAAEALSVRHTFIKSRPLLIASQKSKNKLSSTPSLRAPYKKRPPVTTDVAKRLITNSLGIRN